MQDVSVDHFHRKMQQSVFNYQRAEDKIFVCKFSKNVESKLYHIENVETRGQIA